MTLVMLSVLPLLAGLGYFMSVFMGRFTSKINSSYAGEVGNGTHGWVGGSGA